MKLLYQIHNVGIYMDSADKTWNQLIEHNFKEQFDGFEIYNNISEIEFRLIVRNIKELECRKEGIVVPECSRYLSDGTFISDYLNIGFRIDNKEIVMWTANETWYAPYLLEILFKMEKMTFVHGASVAIDQKEGILILAFGGIGKTCFIANAVPKDRVTMLGDDLILVSEDGFLYSYPRPFCLYEYHQSLFPQYFKKHKVKFDLYRKNKYWLRIKKKSKEILHIKDRTIYSFLPVSPVHLFPKKKIQIKPVELKDIYILRRNRALEHLAVSDIDSPELTANFAMDVILHEWDIGLKVILNYQAHNFKNIDEYVDERYKILLSAIQKAQNIKCIDIPEKMTADEVSSQLNKTILADIN